MYEVIVTRHFYGPRTSRALAADWSGEQMVFRTRDQARAWIADQETQVYHLAHDECARPSYRIRRVR